MGRLLIRVRVALLLAIALLLASCDTGRPTTPNVLLVILDTTRADHLSTYGYFRQTSPNLTRLAEEGERYDDAWAHAPWTLPTIASILTGQPPHIHGATRNREGLFAIRPEITTLAERLQRVGYATAAFINVVWCSPDLSALDRGFDLYDFRLTDESNLNHRSAGETTDAALAWLEGQRSEPFFLVMHYFDPHLTYDAPAPFDTRFEPDTQPGVPRGFGSAQEVHALRDGSLSIDDRRKQSLVARYDGEIAYTDEQFGRLRAELERLGHWERTLVVVVGDHGEEFWDHGGFEHGHSHQRELLRVPLIVRRPGGAAASRHDERVRQIDIAPTILELAQLAADGLPGRALGDGGSPYAVAEGSLWAGDLVSVRADEGTLILDRSDGSSRYFAPTDPGEMSPLEAEGGPGAALLELLRGLPAERSRTDEPGQLSEEQKQRLRSLGYL